MAKSRVYIADLCLQLVAKLSHPSEILDIADKNTEEEIRCILCCECSLKSPRQHSFYAPNFEKVGEILVLACPYVCMCVCVCVCIHVRDIVLKLHVWIPHGKKGDTYFWFSLNYLPLSNYGHLTNKRMKFCKCCISKSIIARNLKLVMLIGYDD